MKLRTTVAFLLACLTAPLFAQEMPKPGPEHQKLANHAGVWEAAIEMIGQDGQPAMSKGVSKIEMGLGGFWLLDSFSAEMMGTKFEGRGVTGFDPGKGKYVGTWIDSWSTSVMVLEGGYDKDGKVLTMTGTGTGMDGKPTVHRLVTTEKDANTSVFEMFVPGPDGKEMKVMTITYTRKGAKNEKDRK